MPKSQVQDATESFIEDVLEYMLNQPNLYHCQIQDRLKISSTIEKVDEHYSTRNKEKFRLNCYNRTSVQKITKNDWSTDSFIHDDSL